MFSNIKRGSIQEKWDNFYSAWTDYTVAIHQKNWSSNFISEANLTQAANRLAMMINRIMLDSTALSEADARLLYSAYVAYRKTIFVDLPQKRLSKIQALRSVIGQIVILAAENFQGETGCDLQAIRSRIAFADRALTSNLGVFQEKTFFMEKILRSPKLNKQNFIQEYNKIQTENRLYASLVEYDNLYTQLAKHREELQTRLVVVKKLRGYRPAADRPPTPVGFPQALVEQVAVIGPK